MTFVQDRQAWLHRECPRRNILLEKDVFVEQDLGYYVSK